MLITRRNDTLLLVDQVAHGRLAGDIAQHWGGTGPFERPEPFHAVHAVATAHDDGWRAPDAQPLFNADQARPLHFLEIDLLDHVPLYREGVEEIIARDRYAGLLASMHWAGLYRGRWGMQAGDVWGTGTGAGAPRTALERVLDEAVAAEELRWTALKQELGAGRRSEFEARLWHNYDLLQVLDFLSLYVCTMDLAPDLAVAPRPLAGLLGTLDAAGGDVVIEHAPTAVGGPAVDLTLRPLRAGVVAVDPYPFDEDPLRLTVAGREIPDQAYASPQEARAALDGAVAVEIVCELTRGGGPA